MSDWETHGYWDQDARNDRDERDLDVRHVETDRRDRLTRDAGESPNPTTPTEKEDDRG